MGVDAGACPSLSLAKGEAWLRLESGFGRHWLSTPLGPPETWPQSLRTLAAVALDAPDPMLIVWGPGRTMLYNEAFAPVLGARHPEALGRDLFEAWPELDGEARRAVDLAQQGQATRRDDVAVALDQDGGPEAARFAFSFVPVRDEAGAVVGVFCPCREASGEVSARRRIQAEFHEAEEVMRIAQRAGRIGSFELFPDRGRIVVSEEFCRLWGVTDRREWDVGDFMAQVHPEDLAQLRTGGPSVDNAALEYREYRIRRADTGEERWMARRGEVLVDASGRTRYLGVSYDITDRKRAELALQRLADTLETQVDARTAERDRMWRLSTDVMLVADFGSRIVAINPAGTALLGWEEAELIGRPFLDLLHPDDLEATRAEIRRLDGGPATLGFENRVRRRDGGHCWLSWTAVPDDRFIHAVGRDVTREKQAAAELEEAQAALRQAQKMEAVGQLTGGIAHDFNNLLTGVLGSLDLLNRRVQQGRIHDLDRYVAAASKSATRAATLTQRLLAFSRRQPLDPKVVDVGRLLHGMDELLQRSLGMMVTLKLACAQDLWPARCDPHQLESAVLNLAINARDAMPEGGELAVEILNVELDAGAARERQVKPGQYVCVSVADTGVGIAPEILHRVVEPFFTTKPIGQGTGLGLSMVYGFAQQSEGHLEIESEPGRGATVKLYLPRAHGAVEEVPEDARPGASSVAAGRDEVVLVVEDEDIVRSVVVDIVSELGCRTLEAFDGPSGLEVLQSGRRIDLLITDVGLPGLNGRQLADAARALRPALKVLFMTGYAENAAAGGGFLEPGMQIVTKPFAVADLSVRVREMLGATVETPVDPGKR